MLLVNYRIIAILPCIKEVVSSLINLRKINLLLINLRKENLGGFD